MKFSLNLAQYYSNVDLKSFNVDDIVKKMGLQLGAIEEVEEFEQKYQGIVVAKVVSCEKHPNADKLSLCFVDDGGVTTDVERNENGYVQVVCGAPNVREGIIVAWIPPGATVPSTYSIEPFVLESREIRGKISNGMLASPKELDISDEHDGILEIAQEELESTKTTIGASFSKLYGLDDTVIDCENKMFTHRPDCFGNLGIARELAGIFSEKYVSPEWYTEKPVFDSPSDPINLVVSNNIKELVPRFSALVMKDIEVGPSPSWMQGFLKRCGFKPINNVVDITNYVMHLTGQPLHAFDYDKLQQYSDLPSLSPRLAHAGEKLELLNGKEIELTTQDIVISTDAAPVALAGIMGGSKTEVDSSTKNIVIECANFDMYAIRRTSMRHGLFTDAVTRFNKGQSPLQNDVVMAYAMKLMQGYASAETASQFYDIASFDLESDNLNRVNVTAEFINSRLGTAISAEKMKELLENVEFEVELSNLKPQTSNLNITVPFWRMDIAIREDIVEEIGRLHGYQNIVANLPPRTTKPAAKNRMREYKQTLRDQLVSRGANEVLTYSFVHGDLLRNTGTDPDKWAYHVRNALSPDLQYYRTSLTPSLLAKVHGNIKAQAGSEQNEFALFEIGKAHVKDHMEDAPEGTLPKQMRRIACVLAADKKTARKYGSSAYYQAKKYVDMLTNGQATYEELESNEYPITSVYQKGRSAMIMLGSDNQVLGVIGEYNTKARKSLKLPDYCAGFEIDLDLMYERLTKPSYKVTSQYPSSSQDVTYEVPASTPHSEVTQFIQAELHVFSAQDSYQFELAALDIFAEESSDKKRVSYRITAAHPHKTLRSAEMTKLLDTVTEAIGEKLQAIRI